MIVSALFLDFAKAYDSVSRCFLLRLLRIIGIPSTFRNIIRALFFNVVGFPVLHSYQNIGIKLQDGLKQGSPLSPIFFLLVIDPLLELLDKIPDIDPRCFADDLAVGFKLWNHIRPVFPVIDSFSRASGIKMNFKKKMLGMLH